ncbi:MAG: hypothetical protein WCR66_13790 [Bacteroidota bacterium]
MQSIEKAQKASKNASNDKFARINELPEDKRELLLDMLKRHSPNFVAEEMQSWGFSVDIKTITLSHILEKYRKNNIHISEIISSHVVAKETARLRKGIDFINELQEFYYRRFQVPSAKSAA